MSYITCPTESPAGTIVYTVSRLSRILLSQMAATGPETDISLPLASTSPLSVETSSVHSPLHPPLLYRHNSSPEMPQHPGQQSSGHSEFVERHRPQQLQQQQQQQLQRQHQQDVDVESSLNVDLDIDLDSALDDDRMLTDESAILDPSDDGHGYEQSLNTSHGISQQAIDQQPGQALHQTRSNTPAATDSPATPTTVSSTTTMTFPTTATLRRRPSRAGTRSVTSLSAAQLERKRANDREAQRAIRQRTKDHIESLERQIADLTASEADGHANHSHSEEYTRLANRNRELELENAALRRHLRGAHSHGPVGSSRDASLPPLHGFYADVLAGSSEQLYSTSSPSPALKPEPHTPSDSPAGQLNLHLLAAAQYHQNQIIPPALLKRPSSASTGTSYTSSGPPPLLSQQQQHTHAFPQPLPLHQKDQQQQQQEQQLLHSHWPQQPDAESRTKSHQHLLQYENVHVVSEAARLGVGYDGASVANKDDRFLADQDSAWSGPSTSNDILDSGAHDIPHAATDAVSQVQQQRELQHRHSPPLTTPAHAHLGYWLDAQIDSSAMHVAISNHSAGQIAAIDMPPDSAIALKHDRVTDSGRQSMTGARDHSPYSSHPLANHDASLSVMQANLQRPYEQYLVQLPHQAVQLGTSQERFSSPHPLTPQPSDHRSPATFRHHTQSDDRVLLPRSVEGLGMSMSDVTSAPVGMHMALQQSLAPSTVSIEMPISYGMTHQPQPDYKGYGLAP